MPNADVICANLPTRCMIFVTFLQVDVLRPRADLRAPGIQTGD